MSFTENLLATGLVPDFIIRSKIRSLLRKRLKDENQGSSEADREHFFKLIAELKSSQIAVNTNEANEQHYEVSTEFYQYCLGKHLKYSSCLWGENTRNLDEAEVAMLELTIKRAELSNDMDILELGCGWGSLTLFMAAKFPNSKITAISNSSTQKIYIDKQAAQHGFTNITVITSDINNFSAPSKYDRIVSVEMFEHLRNYQLLLARINTWLKPEGKLFVHIFTHKKYAYKFEVKDDSDWMSKYFFTGGIMPSDHLLLYFPEHVSIEKHWLVNGLHYAKTARAWLENTDKNKTKIIPIMEKTYGKNNGKLWLEYWRIFFMACEELWAFNLGNEWMVSHYLFKKNNL